ncbi:MAG: ABC transporter permease subunit [Leptolyngbyaceae cyanobacterium MO_188.B28]|nr:ABC transporter permease subunit [Leptolyngbyaceae cyanobacterium MO_188.B28]
MVSESGGNGFSLRKLLRDDRFWKAAFQVLTLMGVCLVFAFLISNLNRNMARQSIKFGFSFLSNPANFSIGESVVEYRPQDSYAKALFVGLLNTLNLMTAGIVWATIVGITAGVASFSQNWLVHKISRAYVGVIRNTPLLLQLFFWYFAIYGLLPRPQAQLSISNLIFLNNRAVYIPWPANTSIAWASLGVLIVAGIAALIIWRWRIQVMVEKGASGKAQGMALMAIGAAALIILVFGLGWQAPQGLEGGGATGGLKLSREYAAALTGLTCYTAAFIAEIVRAGIQSVSLGQWEAARSLGLAPNVVMRLVVFPQALRVIIPPLNSEFMNLAKNTSLAFAIGFPELYSVATTTYSPTGRPVEVFLILMATYLTINLLISLGMNQLNQAVQFKER